MRVVLLTTETPHHLYYAWRLKEAGALDAILLQTEGARFAFPTAHPFERARDEYELATLLERGPRSMADVAPVFSGRNPNTPEALAELRRLEPDVAIVFGTGVLAAAVLSMPRIACLNLHGGNPEEYRGLDSHLWAIYHRDFGNLTTTLHHLAPEIDAGDVVFETQVALERGMALHQLRAANTKACVTLSLLALGALREGLPLPARRQLRKGRYYSAMPAVLKEACVASFARHVAAL